VAGRHRLERKARRYAPRWIAVLGVGAYRQAFARPAAGIGAQPERIGRTRVWVLPNPSGINANHLLPDLARAFRALRRRLSLRS
jgi:TDG/mug DNA glycosylase family protein